MIDTNNYVKYIYILLVLYCLKIFPKKKSNILKPSTPFLALYLKKVPHFRIFFYFFHTLCNVRYFIIKK